MEIRTSEDATLSPVADSNGSDNNKMEEQVSPPDTSGPPQQRLEALLPSTATCPQQGSLTRVSGQMEHGSELPGAEEAGHGVEREAEAAGEAHPGSEMMVGAGQILAANQDRMHLGMGRGRMDLAKEASRHSYCLDAADSLAKEGPMPGKRSVDDDAPPRSGLHKVPATALQPDAADISEVGDGAWPLALPPISTGPETDGDDEQIEDDDQSLSSSPFASNPENPEVSSDDLLAPSGDGARAALRGTWPATKLSADDFPAVGMYTSSATALPIPGAVERDPQARQVNQLEGQWEAAANQEQPRAIERVSSVSLGLVGHRAGSSSSLVINFDDDDDDGGCDDEDSKPSGARQPASKLAAKDYYASRMEELRSRIAAMENGSAKAGSSGPPSRIWRRSPEPQQQQQQQRLPPVARSASNLQPRNQAPELQQPKTGDEAADERETVRQKLQEMEAKLTAAKVQRLQSEAGKRAIKPPAGSVALRASGSSAMLQAAAAKAREASAAAAETVGTTAENAGGAAPVMAAGTDEAGKPGAPKNQIPKAGSSPSLRQLTDSKQQDEAAQLKAKLQAMEAQIQIMNKKVAAGKAQRAASKPQGGGQKDVSQAQGGVQQSVSKSQAGGQQPVSKSQGSGQQAVSTPQLPRPSRQPPPAQQQADRQQQLPQGNPLQVIRHQALQQQVSNQADQFLEGLFVSDVSHSASHQQPWLMPSMALPSPMMNYFAMAGQPILPGWCEGLMGAGFVPPPAPPPFPPPEPVGMLGVSYEAPAAANGSFLAPSFDPAKSSRRRKPIKVMVRQQSCNSGEQASQYRLVDASKLRGAQKQAQPLNQQQPSWPQEAPPSEPPTPLSSSLVRAGSSLGRGGQGLMGLPLAPHEERLYEQLEETQRDKQGVQVRRALLRQQMEELTVRWKSLKNREDAICRTLGLTSGPPSPSKGSADDQAAAVMDEAAAEARVMRERHLAGLRKQHLQLHTTGGKQQSGTAPLLLPGSSSAAGCGIGSDHPKTKAPAGPPAPASLGDVATLSAAAAVAATATQPHINAGAQASLAAELATEDLEAGEIPMDLVHTSSRDSDPDGRDSWRDRDRQGDRSRERDRGKGRGRDRPRDRTNKEWTEDTRFSRSGTASYVDRERDRRERSRYRDSGYGEHRDMDRERDRDYGPERRRGGRSRSRSLSPSPRSLQHDRRPSSPTPAPTRPRKIAEQTEITRAAAKTPRAATKQTTIASSLPDAEPGASKSNARHATEVKLAVAVKKVPATSGSLASTTIEQGTAKSLGLGASNVPPEAGREAGSARAGDKGLSIAKVTTAKTSAKDLKTATPETNSATAGEAVEAPSRPDKKAEAEGAASGATGDRLQAKLAGAPRVPEVSTSQGAPASASKDGTGTPQPGAKRKKLAAAQQMELTGTNTQKKARVLPTGVSAEPQADEQPAEIRKQVALPAKRHAGEPSIHIVLGQLPAKAAGREQRAGPAGSTDARAARHGAKGAGISLLLRFGEFSRTPAASQQGMGVALVRDEGELRRRKPDDHRTRFTSATLDDLSSEAMHRSPLLLFRSSRLLPHFQERSGGLALTSPALSHCMDPLWPLCPYELHGECRNPGCAYQSIATYTLTPRASLLEVRAMAEVDPDEDSAPANLSSSEAESLAIEAVASAKQRQVRLLGEPAWAGVHRPSTEAMGPHRSTEVRIRVYHASHGHGEQREQFRSTLLSSLSRVPLRALQTQAALSEHLPLGDIVRPQPPRAELLSLLRAHQSRYHTPTSARPETGAVNSAGEPSLPPEVGALLAKDPWQPELWATAAMEQMGWQMDWSNDSHIRVERALKVLALGLESNNDDVLLWMLHMKLYKDGPLTKRKVERDSALDSYVQAALRFRSDCYRLWKMGIQMMRSLPAYLDLQQRALHAMLDSWQGGGSAADLGLASCLLDSALCLLETWSNAGDHAASIQWVQLLLAAAPSDPAGQTPGSGLHRLAMLRTALPVSELTVLWLSAASVAALGCLPREVHERLGHKQTPVVLAWDTTVLLSVPRERQAVASASLAAALQSFAELLTPGADQPPGAALGGSGDPLRAALLSAIGWRAAGGAWDDSGQALPSPAEQARQWAAALSKADFASSRCLQNLPGWLRRAAVIVDTSGSHHHQAGTTAQKPWSAVLDGISAERIKVGQLEWGTLAAAALQQGGQEAALRVLMEGAAVALHAAAGSPPRKGNQVGAQTGAEDQPADATAPVWRSLSLPAGSSTSALQLQAPGAADSMWELLEGQENGRAQGLPRDERCAALLNLALLDSMSGKPDRSSHAMEAALREADGDEAMSRLVWEEYMALATTALTCYSTESGVRRCRWQSLLALILRLVDGPMVLVDLPAVDWSPPAGSGDERQVQPRALPKDRRLALIMQPEDTCCATWAADLLLSTVLPCLQPRERVELVEALRRPLCGSPSFARLATAAACAHCAELEGAASPVRCRGAALWAVPIAVEALGRAHPAALPGTWLEATRLASKHCLTAAMEVSAMALAVNPFSADLFRLRMELAGQEGAAEFEKEVEVVKARRIHTLPLPPDNDGPIRTAS